MEPWEGKMTGTPNPDTVSTRLQRIAKLARAMPGVALRTLAQYIDIAFLREAYPLSSGSSHVKYAPDRWSLPDAIKIPEGLGYKGIYALEGSGPDPYATTQTMLDALLPLI